jgi:hypothetical protein
MFAIARTVEDTDGTTVKLAIVYSPQDGIIISKENPETGEILETMNFTHAAGDALYHMFLMTYTAVSDIHLRRTL